MEVKVGKSRTRRYYEDLLERFETEARYINQRSEFDKKKTKITTEFRQAYDMNIINLLELQRNFGRLEKIRFQQNKKMLFSKEELKNIAAASSKIECGEDSVSDNQFKNKDISEESEEKNHNIKYKER